MKLARRCLLAVLVMIGFLGVVRIGAAEDEVKSIDEDLTLERLFPKKSIFGPSARSTSFSHDGRYAAYLYRPYLERRHGNDLWIYDTETGEATRVTMVSVLSEFQAATREVAKDRLKKAKKRSGKKKPTGGPEDATGGDPLSGTWEGVMHGDDALELPPDGLPFTLTLELNEDGSVSGTLRTFLNISTITEARWDASEGKLTATLTEPESGLTGTLVVTVKDGSMSGTLTVEDMNAELELTAERTQAGAGDEEDGETEDDGDGEEQEGEGEGEGDDEDDGEEGEGDDEDDGIDERDVVGEKDADDDKAPRYGGVTGFVWSPTEDELIFTSGGDLYEFRVAGGSITRLTRTRERESSVQYLPDGTGYAYRRDGSVMRITFGSHLIEQIDPEVPGGERLSGYRVSPDGTALAFVTSKGGGFGSGGGSVTIVNYRGRFARAREVNRHMSDQKWPDGWWTVYVYPLEEHLQEGTKPTKLYEHKRSGPRDYVSTPR